MSLNNAIQRRGANVCSTPVEIPAVARAKWLAEVAETLQQAEALLKRLKLDGDHAELVAEVEFRILVARREVESLRTSRPHRNTGPRWINFPPWEISEPGRA
jgi:hypothetical protein